MKRTNINNQKGQVLLLTLLVAVVALTVVVAASTRSTTDVRLTEATTEAERAYSAAEAGIEEKLFEISQGVETPAGCDDTDADPNNDCDLTIGDGSVDQVVISTEKDIVINSLPVERNVQIRLVDNFDPASRTMDYDNRIFFRWDQNAALVVSIIARNETIDPYGYSVERFAYRCGNIPQAINFQSVVPGADSRCSQSITISAIEASLGAEALMVRFRPMVRDTYFEVTPEPLGANLFPDQIVEIVSTGSAQESVRKLEARRTKDLLPGIFDFAVYSGSNTRGLTTNGINDWIQIRDGSLHVDRNPASGVGINYNAYPNTTHLCASTAGCVISAQSLIQMPVARIHSNAARRWAVPSYLSSTGIDVSRYSYDTLWARLSDQAVDGINFLDPALDTVFANGGVARITQADPLGQSGVKSLRLTDWNELGTNPVVIFIGETNGTDLSLLFAGAPGASNFVAKNVIFVVSGDVLINNLTYRIDAAIITDGKFQFN